MAKPQKNSHGRAKSAHLAKAKSKKKGTLPPRAPQHGGVELVDPLVQAQLKTYEEAMSLFHQQKFQRAKAELEKVMAGPSKERTHSAPKQFRLPENRLKPSPPQHPQSTKAA